MMEQYGMALAGMWLMLMTLIVQAFVAAKTKASQPGAVPGKIDPTLSHDSFVYRSHRTFANSRENFSMMFGAAILAILVGADPFWTGILVWLMGLARIVHMLLYYVIATEKNPSPRSFFYALAALANIALMVLVASAFFYPK